MTQEQIRAAVVKALGSALGNTGLTLPDLADDDVAAYIPGLKSEDWVYVIAEIEDELGIEIPDTMNIFTESKNKKGRKRTIRQIVSQLSSVAGTGAN